MPNAFTIPQLLNMRRKPPSKVVYARQSVGHTFFCLGGFGSVDRPQERHLCDQLFLSSVNVTGFGNVTSSIGPCWVRSDGDESEEVAREGGSLLL